MPQRRGLVVLLTLVVAGPLSGQRLDTATALGALRDAAAACGRDAGALWGRSLCGPIALVDRQTRLAVANDTTPGRAWLPYAAAWVSTVPAAAGLANTSFRWGERPWAMILLPLPADRFDRAALVMHEVFHREQEALHLAGGDPANNQLDQRAGRYWLRLELRALAAGVDALAAGDAGAARSHAGAAALFRARRHAIYPGADSLEAALEMQEGLAEYTGEQLAMAVTGGRAADGLARVAGHTRDQQWSPTFVRSFAYGTGPALGILLDRFMPAWRDSVRVVRDPGRLLARTVGFRAPRARALLEHQAERRAAAYGADDVAHEEAAREEARRPAMAAYRARLVDGPTVTLRQTALGRGFDPNALVGWDLTATVYPTGHFSAPWGTLEVTSGGALVANDFTWLRVAAPTTPPEPGARVVRGDGWTLTLARGWTLRPVADRPGSFETATSDPR